MKRACLIALAALALGCAEDTPPPVEVQVAEVAEPATVSMTARVSWPPDPAEDTLALFSVRDMKVGDTGLVLVDRNDRVIVFDQELNPIRSFGRSGSGPGDLDGPDGLALSSDSLAVSEAGNQRASIFSVEGEFGRTVPLPFRRGRSVAMTSHGDLLVPAPSDTHYLEKIGPDGAGEPWAERPAPRAPDPRLPPGHPGFSNDLVALAPGDTLHVLDGGEAEFLTYDASGRLLARTRVPEPLRADLLAETGVMVEGTSEGGSVSAMSAFTHLVRTRDGKLVAVPSRRPSVEGVVAVVFDPADRTLRTLEARGDEGMPSVSALFYQDGLIVATREGEVHEFGVSW